MATEVKPDWHEVESDDGTIHFEAASPYHNDGSPINWRIRMRVCWVLDHDAELMQSDEADETFDTLTEAKQHVAECHRNILMEL